MHNGTSLSSGILAVGGTQVYTGKGILSNLIIVGGSAAATVTVYDELSATGKVLAKGTAPIGETVAISINTPCRCENGIHVVVAGLASEAIVHFGS